MIKFLNKQKSIFIIIIIFTLHLLESNKMYSNEYVYIGKDSIEIINRMMYYHLSLLKHKYTFEDISFIKQDTNLFKRLYDSLSKIYVPFNDHHFQADIGANDRMSGLHVMFTFLIDSNTTYTLWIFIPDKIHSYDELVKSDIKKRLNKLKKIGILAFKTTENIQDDNYKDDKLSENNFYKEYKRALKKLHKRKSYKKSP